MERQSFNTTSSGNVGGEGAARLPRYPMLEMIDQARGELVSPFANDVHATLLEQLAFALANRYWNELAWATGDIPAGAFHRVCNELERLRMLLSQLASEKIESAA